jgi:hypothetical protein
MVLQLINGFQFTSQDPKGTGVYTLADGSGRTLVVWQNRDGWSNMVGTSFVLLSLPANTAVSVAVYGWDGRRQVVCIALSSLLSPSLSSLILFYF